MKTYQKASTSSFRSWLKTVTHNAWIDFVRRTRTGPAPEWLESIADSFDALADIEKEMEQAFERELLELAKLPGRAVFSSRPPGKPSA